MGCILQHLKLANWLQCQNDIIERYFYSLVCKLLSIPKRAVRFRLNISLEQLALLLSVMRNTRKSAQRDIIFPPSAEKHETANKKLITETDYRTG